MNLIPRIFMLAAVFFFGLSQMCFAAQQDKSKTSKISSGLISEGIKSKENDSTKLKKGLTLKSLPESSNDKITVDQFLAQFFLNASCLSGKAKDLIKNNSAFAEDSYPRELKSAISDIKGKSVGVNRLEAQDVRRSLHSYVYKDSSGKQRVGYLDDVSATADYDILQNNVKGVKTFAYTMDCSGYLSFLAGADLRFGWFSGGVDFRQEAKSAYNTKKTFSALRLHSANIVAMALGQFDGNLSTIQSASILYKLARDMNNGKNFSDYYVPRYMDMVSTSINGSSTFNGEVNMQSDANLGVAVANLSINSKGDFKVSRSLSFSDPETFIVIEDIDAYIFTQGDVVKALRSVFDGISEGRIEVSEEDKYKIITAPIGNSFCKDDGTPKWIASYRIKDAQGAIGNKNLSIHGKKYIPTKGCQFKITLDSITTGEINDSGGISFTLVDDSVKMSNEYLSFNVNDL